MLYITGDTHGEWIGRLNTDSFPEQKEMTKDDYVLICGDFGIWDGSKRERYALNWLEKKPFTTLFCDGNHENFDLLNSFPVSEWHGGKVHRINDSVIHLMRGQIYEIEGRSFFVFGGAASHDIRDGILDEEDFSSLKEFLRTEERWEKEGKEFRVNHISWWKEELPSKEEMNEGWENLKKRSFQVDYIITHSPYSGLLSQMAGILDSYKLDVLTDYLQKIKQNTDYHQWIFGHMHMNQMFYWERACCIYEQITRLL